MDLLLLRRETRGNPFHGQRRVGPINYATTRKKERHLPCLSQARQSDSSEPIWTPRWTIEDKNINQQN